MTESLLNAAASKPGTEESLRFLLDADNTPHIFEAVLLSAVGSLLSLEKLGLLLAKTTDGSVIT